MRCGPRAWALLGSVGLRTQAIRLIFLEEDARWILRIYKILELQGTVFFFNLIDLIRYAKRHTFSAYIFMNLDKYKHSCNRPINQDTERFCHFRKFPFVPV